MSEALMDPKLRYVLGYTAGIAILVFVINRVALGTPTQTSFMWSALFAAIAFAMAWRQASQKKKS